MKGEWWTRPWNTSPESVEGRYSWTLDANTWHCERMRMAMLACDTWSKAHYLNNFELSRPTTTIPFRSLTHHNSQTLRIDSWPSKELTSISPPHTVSCLKPRSTKLVFSPFHTGNDNLIFINSLSVRIRNFFLDDTHLSILLYSLNTLNSLSDRLGNHTPQLVHRD